MNNIKTGFLLAVGSLGGAVCAYFGESLPLVGLLAGAMCIDYLSGLCLAGIFKNSPKSPGGGLVSHEGFRGLCRKCAIIAIVWLSAAMDKALGTDFICGGVCISYLCNETLSITENLALMGVPMPTVIKNALDILGQREKKKKEKKEGDINDDR